jgi:hypothetical protein
LRGWLVRASSSLYNFWKGAINLLQYQSSSILASSR